MQLLPKGITNNNVAIEDAAMLIPIGIPTTNKTAKLQIR